MRPIGLAMLFATALLAQRGQDGPHPDWPCVPGRAVDPSYLETSESTGGQLVLLQKGEVEHAAAFMMAPMTHPATIVRAVGHLNGSRDFEFPVDSTVEGMFIIASVQCRERVQTLRPSGVAVTHRDAAMFIELKSAGLLRVDQPEPGKWKVRLSGSGLFVLSVLAKAGIALTQATPAPDKLDLRVAGAASRLTVHLVDATGARIADLDAPEIVGGAYRTRLPSPAQRYRVLVMGEDAGAWPFQRIHPVLFRPPKAP
jgi:hypothetical protein